MAALKTGTVRRLSEKKDQSSPISPTRRWGRPKEALKVFPGGMTKLYEMIGQGRIRSMKVDGMRLVDLEDAANPK